MNILLLHRDFRTKDNTALNRLIEKEKNIHIFFIFNRTQIENNTLFSYHAFHYMVNALKELNLKVKINFFKANSEVEVFQQIISDGIKIDRIYWNKDFTPFALKRSAKLEAFAKKNNIETNTPNDYLLLDPYNREEFVSAKMFTPFWKNMIEKMKTTIPSVAPNIRFNSIDYSNNYSININEIKLSKNKNFPITRKEIVDSINSVDKYYKEKRDMLFLDANSKIAPAIKFGVISIREIVQIVIKRHKSIDNDYLRQIIWREFFYQCHIQKGRKRLEDNLLSRFDNFPWNDNHEDFEAWCQGKTGFDIVDAAMNQLNTTGYMHNRARMITASFLTKNLLIDWRLGEKYFAKKLIDYDPIVNNMSWQWVAGTGFEVNPFFRIFNPHLQKKKFDPEGKYVKKWLIKDYNYKPIIDYKKSRERALELYKKTFSKK